MSGTRMEASAKNLGQVSTTRSVVGPGGVTGTTTNPAMTAGGHTITPPMAGLATRVDKGMVGVREATGQEAVTWYLRNTGTRVGLLWTRLQGQIAPETADGAAGMTTQGPTRLEGLRSS